jgi:hypothetical protein
MADELKLSRVENAEDFLTEAVKYAKAASPRDWKYASLHLWTALELLLKALLENEHWSLLFEDVNKASRKKLAEGDFQTVRFDTALDRIRGIVGISLNEKDLQYLRRLRDLRNRVTHSTVELNIEQAKFVVARGISVFLTLEQKFLHEEPDKAFEYEINQALQDFQKYVDARLRELKSDLKAADRPHRRFRSAGHAGRRRLSVATRMPPAYSAAKRQALQTWRTTIAKARPAPVPRATAVCSRSSWSTMTRRDSYV